MVENAWWHQEFFGLVILEKALTSQGIFYIRIHRKCLMVAKRSLGYKP
jgi:hypothetical protein